jgi:hypothetical protein
MSLYQFIKRLAGDNSFRYIPITDMVSPSMPMIMTYRDEWGNLHDVTQLYLSGTKYGSEYTPSPYSSGSHYTGLEYQTGTMGNPTIPPTYQKPTVTCFYCGQEKQTIRCPNCGGSKTL